MADNTDYSSAVSQFLQQDAAPPQPNVHASLALAAGSNPDYEAELTKLSQQTGVPLESVRSVPDAVKQQAFLQDANPSLLERQFPKTAAFLGNPDNARIAHDDIHNLSTMETLINGVQRGWKGLQQFAPTMLMRANTNLLGEVDKIEKRLSSGTDPSLIPDSDDPFAIRFMTPAQRAAFRQKAYARYGNQATTSAALEQEKQAIPQPPIVSQVQAASKQGWRAMLSTFTHDPVNFLAAVGTESVVQNAPALATAAAFGLAGNPAGAIAVTGAGSFLTDYASSLQEGLQSAGIDTKDPAALKKAALDAALMERVGRAAFAHAAVVSAFDTLSAGVAGKVPLPKRIASNQAAKYAAHAVLEPNLQGLMGAAGEAGGELAQGQPLDPFNIFSEYVGEFAQTPGEHGGAAARKVYGDIRAAQQAKDNVALMTSLGDAAKESKLSKRMPEKLREFIQAAKAGGEVDNVYIPAERFAQYFQSAQADPAQVATEIGVKNYQEALAAGSDLVIPLEDYIAHVAPTEHHQGLLADLRLHQGDMTLREADAFEKSRDHALQQFKDDVNNAAVDTAAPGYQQVHEQMLGQLVHRYDRATADSYATLYAKGITTLAARSGLDPVELHHRYGLSVQSPLPQALAKASTDSHIDPLLDRLRAGETPTEQDTLAQLGDWLQQNKIDLNSLTNEQVRQALQATSNIGGEIAGHYNQFAGQESRTADPHALATAQQRLTAGDDVETVRQATGWFKGADGKWRYEISDRGAVLRSGAQSATNDQAYIDWADEAAHREQGVPLSLVLDHPTLYAAYPQLEGVRVVVNPDEQGLNASFNPGKGRFGTITLPDPYSLPTEKSADLLSTVLHEVQHAIQAQEEFASGGNSQLGADRYRRLAGEVEARNTQTRQHLTDEQRAAIAPELTADVPQEQVVVIFNGKELAHAPMPANAAPTQLHQDGDNRGYIQFGKDRKFSITLLEKADLSTLSHELGHFWLEVMGDLATDPAASAQVKDDYATLLKWFGVESRDQIKTEHHEQFARGWEAYLMEGKAPSQELRGVFQKFKAWMLLTYKQLTRLNVKLNDDVRGVFDRLIASDAEIDAAKSELDLAPLFATAADMGVTEPEFEAYRKTTQTEIDAAKDALQLKLMKEYQRAQQTWYQEETKKVRAEVTKEVEEQPVHLAFDGLTKGQLADGTPVKLNKQDLVDRYGADFIKKLPRSSQRVYAVDGGMAVDLAAEVFGYPSGDALIKDLANMTPKKAVIDAETQARMIERHGDLRFDGTLHEEAVAALHNEQRAQVLAAELRALKRQQAKVKPVLNAMNKADAQARSAMQDSIPPISAFRDAAKGLIGQKQVRDVNPQLYLNAERKASKQAFTLAAKEQYQEAAAAKQRELLNHYLYREAVKAQEEVGTIVGYAKKLQKPAAQSRIGKAGGDFLDNINALLEQYEFKTVSGTQLTRRANLRAWYDAQLKANYTPPIPQELLDDAAMKNYKTVPFDELRAVYDALRAIDHLVGLKNELLLKGKKIAYEDGVAELLASAEQHATAFDGRSPFKSHRSKFTKAGDWASKLSAELLPVEAALDVLDGGRADGPWHRFIFNRMSDAQTEYLELMGSLGNQVNTLVEEHAQSGKMDDLFTTSLSGKPVSRYELISIALNVGNAQNYDKLVRGMSKQGWTEQGIHEALSNLNAADAAFIQQVWDQINTLWPTIEALEKRLNGIAPPKVEAREFIIRHPDGTPKHVLKGGYYPLVYDPDFSQAGKQQETGPLAGLLEQGPGRAVTQHGFTEQRTQFAAPLLFDFGQVLQKHLHHVVKDVTHREAFIDANRLFTDDRIRATLQQRLGKEYEAMFMPWLKGIASDGIGEDVGPLGKVFEKSRAATTTVALGFKVGTMLAQGAGILNSIEYVGAGWISKGFRQAMASGPHYAFKGAALDKVLSKSGEMRHRFDTLDRDVRDRLRDINLGKTAKGMRAIERAAFTGIGYADRMVAIPTWLGAYEKALSQGMAEAEAIHAADGAVRRSQGAGGAKDLTQLQRRGGAMKAFTMFMTPMAAAYGRMYSAKRALDAGGLKYAPAAVMRVLMVTAFPAILADLLTGRGPDQCALDDPACYAKWAAIKGSFSISGVVPVLREIGTYAENVLNGHPGARDIRISPVLDMFTKLAHSAQKTLEVAFGDSDADQKFWADLVENSGYVLNLPTSQARITIEYLYDLMRGDSHPESPGTFLHDMAFRRKDTP